MKWTAKQERERIRNEKKKIKRKEYVAYYSIQRKWFAWRPITIGNTTYWLKTLNRKLIEINGLGHYYINDTYNFNFYSCFKWEYSLPTPKEKKESTLTPYGKLLLALPFYIAFALFIGFMFGYSA